MDEKRWLEIEEVLQRALDLEPSQRAAFLKKSCAGDATLLGKVEALLNRENEAGSFLESPAVTQLFHQSDPPSQISHYKIESRIGVGGMGQVYKAHDENLGRVVALKMLPMEFVADPERVRRFRQEAFAASRLNHPNIITIFEIVEQDGNHFIAEEYVEGQTLRATLECGALAPLWPKRREAGALQRRLSLEHALDIAIQILRALKAAHTAWIIHRDIKPENIMIRADGLVKVLDFGIAKLGDEAATPLADAVQPNDPTATIPGVIMGTASYMSPEQARGESLDGRTDLFSLGILLYEMITGLRLFGGSTRAEAIQRLQHGDDLVRPGFKLGHVPKELQRILRRSLQSNREERYASAGELLDDLLAFKHRLESRSTRRIVGVSAAIVVLALAVVGIAAFLSVNETWEEKIFRDGHTAAVRRAVFSPDGRLLVSVGEDHQVIVWDFARRMRLKTLTEHMGVVNTVAFSPDGRWFITGDEQQTVIVWNAARLQPETIWRDQLGPVRASAFSPDGHLLIYAAGEVSVVREAGTWKKLRELPCWVNYGHFLFLEGSRLVEDSHGRRWDLQTGKSISDTQVWEGNWTALSPDHKRLASIDAYGYVNFVDPMSRKVISQAHGHHDHGRSVAYSPDGKLIATGAERVVLWDATSMTWLVPLEYESIVWSVAFSPDGRWLVSTHGDGSILIWDVLNRELRANLRQHSGAVRAVAFSADGKLLATASEDQSIILWDAESGRKETVLRDHNTRVGAVTFSPDGRWFASSDQSGVVIRHDLGQELPKFVTQPAKWDVSYCLAVSPDRRFIATSFFVYNAESGTVVFGPSPNWHAVYSAAFTKEGGVLVGVTDAGEVLVLDTNTWQLIERQKWSSTPLVTLSLSPDDNHIVTGEDGKAIRWGTIKPLQQLAVIGQHTARVKAVAFSPDGRQVASAGDDKMVALWDVNRRKLLTTIGTHTSPIYALAFSTDGRRLVTGEHDRSVRQYTRHRTLWGFSLE